MIPACSSELTDARRVTADRFHRRGSHLAHRKGKISDGQVDSTVSQLAHPIVPYVHDVAVRAGNHVRFMPVELDLRCRSCAQEMSISRPRIKAQSCRGRETKGRKSRLTVPC